MWKLVIEDDEGKRTVVHLTRDQYTVGRKEGNAIRLTERNISRDHAKLSRPARSGEASANGSSYLLEDLDSYNGVFVNGMRISKAQEMIHGDLIQIGDYRVVIQDDALDEAPGQPTVPDPEDLKATLVPGKVRARGTMLLERPNRFVMLVGPTPGAEYPLDKDLITIGRAEDASISVNHNSVSRMHCEIHKLAEGRYEIVDNASSNGVRVNGSDLSRGIVEAGDIIELGDVRFRFVAAGQVFLANASDSQQLAAITDRQADGVLGARKSSIAPFVLLGLLLGGAAVAGAYFLTRPAGGTTDTITPAASDVAPTAGIPDAEKIVLADARRLVLTNPEAAHQKLLAGIGATSPARTAPDFLEVENKWAEDMFVRAERTRDRDQAIGLLKQVADTPSVPDVQRAKARQLTEARANPAPVEAPSTQSTGGGLSAPGSSHSATSGATVSPASAGTGGSTGTGSTGTTGKPAGRPDAPAEKSKSRIDRAHELVQQGNFPAAKALLLPILSGSGGTTEELTQLRAICRNPRDQRCIDECDKRLKK